jgi:hypothetical protein
MARLEILRIASAPPSAATYFSTIWSAVAFDGDAGCDAAGCDAAAGGGASDSITGGIGNDQIHAWAGNERASSFTETG